MSSVEHPRKTALTPDQRAHFDDMVRREVAAETDWDCVDWFLENGNNYTPRALPADIDRGEVGTCFDWCVVSALHSNGKYRYVEGVARRTDIPNDYWRLHAWMTPADTDGSAFDPTWGMRNETGIVNIAPPFQYKGIVMDIKAVSKFMLKTEYAGVLANAHRAPKDARRAYQSIVPVPVFKTFYAAGPISR